MKKLLTILSMLLILAAGWYLGTLSVKPQVITETRIFPEYVKIPEYIYKTKTVEVEVEKIVEVEKPVTRTKWQNFESLAEYAEWSEKLSVLWITGQVVDCDDYSEFVWDMAYKDGYRMSEPLVRDGTYFGVTVNKDEPHIGGQVQIGNKYYYFEPNPLMYRLIYITDRD